MESTPVQTPETVDLQPVKPIGLEQIVEEVALDCMVRPREYLNETRTTGGGE